MMSVEVERKFVCDADIQKTLEGIGGVCIGERQFHDKYYDTPDFILTLKDIWLRQRRGCWELKCPTAAVEKAENSGTDDTKQAALCSRYIEITSLPEIQQRVNNVLKDSVRDGKMLCQLPEGIGEDKICSAEGKLPIVDRDGPKTAENGSSEEDEAWLSKLNLLCFAAFTTVRRSFTLEEGVHIDLDKADFGYCVGEIEVMVPEGEDMQPAMEKIEKTAQKLGLTGDQRVQGKMDVYLQRYCPEHYAKLLSANIL